METQKVNELTEIQTVSTSDSIMLLTDEIDNVVERTTVDNLLYNSISTDDNNALKQGVDKKLYVGSALNLYDSEYNYSQGQWVLDNGVIYKSLVDDNMGNPTSDTDYWEEVKLGGGSSELCDIGIALFVDETKGLRRYLNGTTVAINTNTTPFLNRLKEIVALYPSLSCTEAQWQTIASSSVGGQCGKFVIDEDNGTIRLPKIVMPIQGLTNLANLGELVQAGLPNITGTFGPLNAVSAVPYATGAISIDSTPGTEDFGSGWDTYGNASFNASRSSSIYGNSNTVQQEQVQYPYFIQIATGQETESEIINTLELNNPFSMFDCKYTDKTLSNLSWLKSNGQDNPKSVYVKAYECLQVEYNTAIEVGETVTLPSGTEYTKQGLSVKLSTATYTDYDFVLNTVSETFRLPIKSKLASGKAVVGNGRGLGLMYGEGGGHADRVLSNRIYGSTNSFAQFGTYTSNELPTITTGFAELTEGQVFGINTDPTKSGIETDTTGLNLYYYVGETVENANLINAGRIEEQLSEKVDLGANNLNTQGKSLISGLGMPSDRYIDLTAGADGSTYIAPANGYYIVWGNPTAAWGYIVVTNHNSEIGIYPALNVDTSFTAMRNWCPCKKGDVIELNYARVTLTRFRFVYAEGEEE